MFGFEIGYWLVLRLVEEITNDGDAGE